MIAGLLRPAMPAINVISAPGIARERGIAIDEVLRDADADYESLVTLQFASGGIEHRLEGTVFHDGKPRVVRIDNIKVESHFAPQMLFLRNEDRLGIIGRLASAIGECGLNIATFAPGPRPGSVATPSRWSRPTARSRRRPWRASPRFRE